jgi:hypothetical protein
MSSTLMSTQCIKQGVSKQKRTASNLVITECMIMHSSIENMMIQYLQEPNPIFPTSATVYYL